MFPWKDFPRSPSRRSAHCRPGASFVSVVSVTAQPPFADAGDPVAVSARVLNAVNRQQQARASFVVKDAQGQQVGQPSVPVDVTLTVQTSLVNLDLGTFDTTGLANGTYSVDVRLVDSSGQPIPGATGVGSLLVGSPVTASIDVVPRVLPPGTSTVTNTLEIATHAPLQNPPTVVGQAPVAGAFDVARNGDFAYVAGSAGISVFNVAGANLDNPQLLRVVGSATELLQVHGNLLVAVRGGLGSIKLDTFSLSDPANPQFLGTTGDIPYSAASDIVVTDTHVFVVLVNLIFVVAAARRIRSERRRDRNQHYEPGGSVLRRRRGDRTRDSGRT